MSAGRAKPESQLGTDRLFPVLDRVRVTILLKGPVFTIQHIGRVRLGYRGNLKSHDSM